MCKNLAAKTKWDEFVLNGNEKSFRGFYQHYYHYLRLAGAKRGFEAEAVKDAIDEVFLYCWEKRTALVNVNDIHNYVITAFLHKLYKIKNKSNLLQSFDDVFENDSFATLQLPSAECTIINQEESIERSRIIEEQLNALPPRQREIIYQKYFLGLSYSEIAETSGLSVNTVYNTIYTTITKLRNTLPKNILLSVAVASAIFFLYKFC